MKPILKTSLVAVAVSALAGLSAQAQVVIFSENFDNGLSPGTSLAQYYGGDITSYVNAVVPGVGVGGTGGWQVTGTAASGSAGYSYMGAQYQNGGVSGNTSANLSDYTLSFDAWSTGGSLNIQIQTWTAAGFGGSMTGTLNTAPASPGYGNDQTLYGTYTHYSLNLGNTSIFQGNSGMMPNGGTFQVAMQLNGGGATPYSNTMYIDNFMLTMVPEPSVLALCGLGALALLRRKA
jgi:hypothetical protein